jgi:hypothetical protein
MFLNQGRSNKISAVSCVTRPFQVPTEAFNQGTWSILFGFGDQRESDRAAELSGMSHRDMREIQKSMQLRDFIVHNRATRATYMVRPDKEHLVFPH